MKFKATKVKARELKPGDMFSTKGSEYWATADNDKPKSLGERVFLRTNIATPGDQAEKDIFKIEVII